MFGRGAGVGGLGLGVDLLEHASVNEKQKWQFRHFGYRDGINEKSFYNFIILFK